MPIVAAGIGFSVNGKSQRRAGISNKQILTTKMICSQFGSLEEKSSQQLG